MMISEKDVYERLKTCMDPELHVNIVDLGLIYGVEVVQRGSDSETQRGSGSAIQRGNGANRIKIVMTLTTPGCPLAAVFDPMVRGSLEGLPGLDIDEDVSVELTFDPPWVPDMMTDEVKAELGMD